ncbi:MAG: hypothetical protein AAFN74_23185 [Myxococcota bacterium]
MLDPTQILDAASRYLRDHPEELGRAIRSSFGLRFGLPLAVFRWLAESFVDGAKGLDPKFEAVPPGLKVGVTLDRMDTRIRLSTIIYVHRIQVDTEQIRLEIRFEEPTLKVLSAEKTILSALINSGTLSIAQIGSLVRELPGMPPEVVDAYGDRVVFDLMQSPNLAGSRVVKHVVGLISALVTVQDVQTESSDHMDVVLRTLPRGTQAAASALRSHLVTPGLRSVRTLLGLDPRRLRDANGTRRITDPGSDSQRPA